MKIDRLIAITMHLLNREVVSASALAKRFEVSKRTIQRDMEALSQAGIPILSTHGTDGGYEILDGFKLAKQIAGVDDYLNIIIALKGLNSAYDNDKIDATLRKALMIMGGGEQKIFVDFTVAREGAQVNEYMRVMEKAIYEKAPLSITYTNAENRSTDRVVEPLALSFQWYAWYLFAFCTHRQGYRLFKLPRISRCEIFDGRFSKEHGDVEALMKTTSSTDDRKIYHVKLLCKKDVRQQVLEYLHSNVIEEHADGDFVTQLHLPFERMWFSLLMGFGNQVEVLEPEEVKLLLKQKAEEILSMY